MNTARLLRTWIMPALCLALIPHPASAADAHRVALYKSAVIPLPVAAKRVSVGNPGVADIVLLHDRELYVVGKALGATNVTVWDRGNHGFRSFDIEVTHDVDTLRAKLHALFPGEEINVFSAQEQLVLSGEVSSVSRLDAIRTLAGGFLPDCIRAESDAAPTAGGRATGSSCRKGTVVNLLQVGGANQVMLKVTVAEMSRSLVRRLDSNFNILRFGSKLSAGAVQGGARFPDALDADGLAHPVLAHPSSGFGSAAGAGSVSTIGPNVDLFDPGTPAIDSSGLFLSYLSGSTLIEAVIDFSRRNGLAKILSEPTLTTLTGQEAQFLSGGEFPIPVPQTGSNNTTIEFKEFGVGVKFLPLVLDSGRINLTLKVDVSELSSDHRVVLNSSNTTSTFSIPSLTKRSASSTVELGDGQTIGIAGLINDNVRSFVDKFPGLGDLPLIGPLFRSQEYVSGQTELVIFVTPHLARPIAPSRVALPTDSFVPPDEWEFYMLGQTESRRRATRTGPSPEPPAAPPARFGHDTSRGAP